MKNRLLFIPAGVIVVTLLLIGSFCDLSISQAIVQLDNPFSHLMAALTIVPISVCAGFVVGTLFKMVLNKQYKKTWQNIILCVISFGGLIAGSYFLGKYFSSYHSFNLSIVYAPLFGLLAMAPGYIAGFLLYEKMDHKHIIRNYIFLAVTVFFLVAVIQTMKIFFPRLRYTSVVKVGTEYFRPWYYTNFSLSQEFVKEHALANAEEIKSFPSGHSNISICAAFVIMFIPKFFKKLEGKEVYFFYAGFLFFLLVAFSRIFIGAHYLSDTMFAGTLGMVVICIANEIYLRKLI